MAQCKVKVKLQPNPKSIQLGYRVARIARLATEKVILEELIPFLEKRLVDVSSELKVTKMISESEF